MNKAKTTVDRFKKALSSVKKISKRLVEAEMNRVYATKNYKWFKKREGNRNGIQDLRVKNFVKKIKANSYYPILGHIFVDSRGVIIDGHHRFEAMMREGKYIFFMVIDDMTLNEISDYNTNKSSSWNDKDTFASAKDMGLELAVIFDVIRTELLSKYTKITPNDLNIAEMYALVSKLTKFSGHVTRDLWEKTQYCDYARTDEYYNLIESYCIIKTAWVGDTHKRAKACRVIMECTVPENKKAINFNIKRFIANFNKTKFKMNDNGNTGIFVREAIRVHNYKQPTHLRASDIYKHKD